MQTEEKTVLVNLTVARPSCSFGALADALKRDVTDHNTRAEVATRLRATPV